MSLLLPLNIRVKETMSYNKILILLNFHSAFSHACTLQMLLRGIFREKSIALYPSPFLPHILYFSANCMPCSCLWGCLDWPLSLPLKVAGEVRFVVPSWRFSPKMPCASQFGLGITHINQASPCPRFFAFHFTPKHNTAAPSISWFECPMLKMFLCNFKCKFKAHLSQPTVTTLFSRSTFSLQYVFMYSQQPRIGCPPHSIKERPCDISYDRCQQSTSASLPNSECFLERHIVMVA